ncbi:DMT family transporter [Paracoccus sp. Z118]|uniref:DMT family transporter n=1 Tax=Paracoccus sp. Z118 TaxID=2851017 RepID=UPI001C2C1B28|nr:DMT family transporter [Paracoccus sp. Z118]MBV0891103.1 DMT family transporter [Paracoccus sp. Z118]
MHSPAPLKTLAFVVVATTAIVCGDTAGKLLTQAGVQPLFVAWSRFALAALVLAPLLRPSRAEWRSLLDWRLILRAALIVGGISSILTALRTEPIANVFGAFFVGPMVAYLLSALLLGERITWVRTAMLVLGFAGVLLVVRPGADVGGGMIFALLAGTLYGAYLTATRWLAPVHRSSFLLVSQLVIGGVLLLPFGIVSVPAGAGAGIWALVVASSAASAFGNYLLVVVNRTTPATVSAPLIYFQLISATVIGFLVFGDWPAPVAFAGLALIFASGIGGLALAHRRGGDATRPLPSRQKPA